MTRPLLFLSLGGLLAGFAVEWFTADPFGLLYWIVPLCMGTVALVLMDSEAKVTAAWRARRTRGRNEVASRPWGRDGNARVPRPVAHALVFAAGFGGILAVNPNAVTDFTEVRLHGDVTYNDFVNGDRQDEAVEMLTAGIGHTTMTRLYFFDADTGYALATAPTRPDGHDLRDFRLKFGDVDVEERFGPAPDAATVAQERFDITEVAVDQIPAMVAQARQLAFDTGDDEGVSVYREHPGLADGPGRIVVHVTIGGTFTIFDASGKLIRGGS